MILRVAFVTFISFFSSITLDAASNDEQLTLDARRKKLADQARQYLHANGLPIDGTSSFAHLPSTLVPHRTLSLIIPAPQRPGIFKKRKPLGLVSFFKHQIGRIPKDAKNVLRFEKLNLTREHKAKLLLIASEIFIFGSSNCLYLDINTQASRTALEDFLREIKTTLKEYHTISRVSKISKVHIYYRLGYSTTELSTQLEDLSLDGGSVLFNEQEHPADLTFGGVPFDESFNYFTDSTVLSDDELR